MATNISTTIYLSPTAQSQLNQLKLANKTPLTRVDAKRSAVDKEKSAVDSVSKEVEKVKTALSAIETSSAPSADAVKAFVTEFNMLQSMLKTQTSKDGTLMHNSGARYARTDIRIPFSQLNVLQGMKDLGVATTRDGLAVSGTPAAALGADVILALDTAVSKVAGELSNSVTQLTARQTSLDKERTRAAAQVDAANKRTETKFLKYYQAMQAMNAATGSDSSSMFGG